MRIALAQMKMAADIKENYQKSVKLITEAACNVQTFRGEASY